MKHEVHVKKVTILDIATIRNQTKNNVLKTSLTFSIQAPKPMPPNPLRLNPLTGKHVWNHGDPADPMRSPVSPTSIAALAEEWPPKMPALAPLKPLQRSPSQKASEGVEEGGEQAAPAEAAVVQ